jgi:hypothetical protein
MFDDGEVANDQMTQHVITPFSMLAFLMDVVDSMKPFACLNGFILFSTPSPSGLLETSIFFADLSKNRHPNR